MGFHKTLADSQPQTGPLVRIGSHSVDLLRWLFQDEVVRVYSVARSRVLKASIQYSLDHRAAALQHAMQFARGLSTETADTFVGMYVNDWTVDMGPRGKESIRLFLERAWERGLIPTDPTVDFVD